MKPMKIKPTPSEETENKSKSKIKDFFKSAPKKSIEAKKLDASTHSDSTKGFYVQALKDKLKRLNSEDDSQTSEEENITSENNNQEDGACGFTEATDVAAKTPCDDCDKKTAEAQHWQKKYKDLMKLHMKLSARFAEVEMKLNDFLTIAPQTSPSEADDEASEDSFFTSSEIKVLKGISLDKGKDSTFVLQCIKLAYKENPSVLADRTLQGKPEWTEIKEDGSEERHPEKLPLTPGKVSHIKKLFVERIGRCKITSVEFAERIKDTNINKLFASGIKNMAKSHKKHFNGNENLNLKL